MAQLDQVASTKARNALSPTVNEQIFNLESGNLERWTGSQWIIDFDKSETWVNPKALGAFGDGTSHQITATDISNHAGIWLGTYAVGTEWDTVAIQEAIYIAYGPPGNPNSVGGALNNRPIFIPAGKYRISQTLTITKALGVYITGAGCQATTLHSVVPAPGQCLYTNGMSYSYIGNMQIEQDPSVPNLTGGLTLFDWDGDTSHGWSAAHQSNTFHNLYFNGNGFQSNGHMNVMFGVECASSSNSQGSENLWIGCRFIWFEYGWTCRGFNALQNNFLGGNWSNCRLGGIWFFEGSGSVIGGSFQNPGLTPWQQESDGGVDILYSNSANDAAVVHGCRTESPVFLAVGNDHCVHVAGCTITPFIAAWAHSTAYTVGAVVTGPGDGVAYRCTTAGTSGATQTNPPWNAFATSITDGTAVWKPLNFNCIAGAQSADGCVLQYGQVNNNHTRACYLSRADAIVTQLSSSPAGDRQLSVQDNTLTLGGGPNTGTYSPFQIGRLPQTFHNHYLYGPDTAFLFSAGLSTEVGISRADLYNAWLAVYGTITRHTPLNSDFQTYQTNAVGTDLTLAGGSGTGSGTGGAVVLQAAGPGMNGATLNQPIPVLHADTNGVMIGSASSVIRKHYTFTFAWTPGSIPALGVVSFTSSLYGAVPGDVITAAFTQPLPAGVVIQATVSAVDHVRVDLVNLSGTAQNITAGTLRLDTFLHTGLVAEQSASADITQLIGDLGGAANIVAFYDMRITSSVTGTTTVTQVADARGGGVVLTPITGFGNFSYDNVNFLLSQTGTWATMQSAAQAALNPTNALAIVFIGYATAVNAGTVSIATVVTPSENSFGFQMGGGSSPYYYGGDSQFTPQTVGSPLIRVMVGSKPAGASATNTFQLFDGTPVTSSPTYTSASGMATIGPDTGSPGATAMRAMILLSTVPSSAQLNLIRNWAVAKHGATTV